MPFAYTKITGLDSDRLMPIIDPVLSAHEVDGVELEWKPDSHGWLLSVSIERPGTSDPGAGINLEDCSRVSRDISAALDAADLISVAYRLEVGTPGVERRLHALHDFARFAGNYAKIKLRAPVNGLYTIVGELKGMDASERVLVSVPPPERAKNPRNKSERTKPVAGKPASTAVESIQQQGTDPIESAASLIENQNGQQDNSMLTLAFENIHSARLVLQWGAGWGTQSERKAATHSESKPSGRLQPPQRSR